MTNAGKVRSDLVRAPGQQVYLHQAEPFPLREYAVTCADRFGPIAGTIKNADCLALSSLSKYPSSVPSRRGRLPCTIHR